jgi:hypothetical protein
MSKRNQNHVVDGEVVLVDRAKVPQAKPVIEVSHRQAELMRPKRPLSEKQQANLQRLIEQNKARAAAWKGQKVPEQLDDIPEDKVAIQVKPKRPYNRKVPHHFSKPAEIKPAETETESEEDITESEAELPPVKKSRPGKSRKLVAPPTSDEDEESEVEPKPKRVTKKAVKETPVRRRIVSDTSDFDDESDDDHRTNKYMAKAKARLEAVKKIEEQIRAKSNPYASRGLSAF